MRQKIEEKNYLELFEKYYNDFPEGKIEPSESPDFIIKGESKIIGIELTKLFQKSDNKNAPGQAIDSICNSIIVSIKKKLIELNIIPYEVHLSFNIRKSLKQNERDLLANKVCSLIIPYLPKNKEQTELKNNYENLELFPEEIMRIHLIHFPNLKTPFVNFSMAGFIQEDMISDLNDTINKKNITHQKYIHNCDEYWLLIHSIPISSVSFFMPSQKTIDNYFNSNYDRIFFLNSFDRKVFELKISKKTT